MIHVARVAGISYESLRNIIRGANSPTLTTLHRVAIALGCRVSDLVEGVEYDGA